jgi:hypothetical protein
MHTLCVKIARVAEHRRILSAAVAPALVNEERKALTVGRDQICPCDAYPLMALDWKWRSDCTK